MTTFVSMFCTECQQKNPNSGVGCWGSIVLGKDVLLIREAASLLDADVFVTLGDFSLVRLW
jgi:hypothetical protein